MALKASAGFLGMAVLVTACIVMIVKVQKAEALGLFIDVLVARVKEEHKLEDVVSAEQNRTRASGVVKEENEKIGYLVLLTRDICKAEGASGIVFVKPYKKNLLADPAYCDGAPLERYRVEQE